MRSTQSLFPLLLSLIFIVATSCDNQKPQSSHPLIVTSIAPLGDWITEIGGGEFDVEILVPRQANAHTFELRPRQLLRVSKASAIVLMGAGLEYWADKVLQNTDDSARILILSRGRDIMQLEDNHGHAAGNHGHAAGNHGHAEGNPHLWLDPVFAIDAAEQIVEMLIGISPQHETALRRRAAAWTDSLRALDEEIRLARSRWAQRSFVGDHSSWVYFAARYDLEESGVVEAVPGREISAQSMGMLIEQMRASGVRAIFADVRKDTRAMDVLAEATGAGIAWLDPIGSEHSALRYLDLMRYNVREMTRVMR